MILLTGFYVERHPGRRAELLDCLARNCGVRSIEAVHLIVEDASDLDSLRACFPQLAHPKIVLVARGSRATFAEYFAYSSAHLGGKKTILANADIYFDSSLERLADFDLGGKMLCLSRWDIQADGSAQFFEQPASQDAWIFVPPLRLARCDFFPGTLGCDGRVAWEANHAGLEISNPSRSLRANHLHRSNVRRYTEKQRLRGPYHSLWGTYLEVPWIWFVVTGRNRLGDLERSLPRLVNQPRSSTIVIDYSCEQGTGAWVAANYPAVITKYVAGRRAFHGAHARALGAALADEDGLLCFLDADMHAQPGLAEHLLARARPGRVLLPDREGAGFDNVLVAAKRDLDAVGGFDTAYRGAGLEVTDLRGCLQASGCEVLRFDGRLLAHRPETHAGTRDDQARRATGLRIHEAYGRAKRAIVAEGGSPLIAEQARVGIYRHIATHHWAADAQASGCAEVLFRETMGYAVARLARGVSSHRNEHRPFRDVHEALLDREFTQVVASRVSPVQVRFAKPGKAYVLVGTDWDGQWAARRFLRDHGVRERLPPQLTDAGTEFEVWSVGGDADDELTIPTQVMLVADRLAPY